GPHPRMSEEIPPELRRRLKRLKEMAMRLRQNLQKMQACPFKRLRIIRQRQFRDAIGMERLKPAEIFPGLAKGSIPQKLEHGLLMVPLEKDMLETGNSIADEPVNDLLRLKPPVHIIPEIDHDIALARRGLGIRFDLLVKTGQQVVAAVNVAYGIDAQARWQPRFFLRAAKRAFQPRHKSTHRYPHRRPSP